jgi:hypothetical protein
MRKFLVCAIVVLLVFAAGTFVFQKQIFHALEGYLTEGMFVAVDADAFDPGIAVGEQFPNIRS